MGYLSLRHHSQAQLLIHDRGTHFREVALVGHKATPSKAAGAAELMQPLGPLWVEVAIGFLILGLEHSNVLLKGRGSAKVFNPQLLGLILRKYQQFLNYCAIFITHNYYYGY